MSYREAIITEAMRLFAERGFKEASVAELSKLTGAAEGTIFHHFASKDELLVSVLERIRAEVTADMDRFVLDAEFDDGLSAVDGIIRHHFRLSEAMPDAFQLLFRTYPLQLAVVDPECREHIEASYDAFVVALADAIERGQRDGSVRDGVPSKLALVVLATLSGLARFKAHGLWPTASYYQEARAFCTNALAARGRDR